MANHLAYFIREGIIDLVEAFRLRHIWGNLALFEIRSRYKRTKLGPLWITLSTLVLLVAMGPLYAKLFNKEVGEYYLYIACGFVFWNYLTTNISENAKGFHEAQGMLLSYGFPVSLYIYKTIFRNIIIMLHNVVIVVLAIVVFSEHFGIFSLVFFAGYVLAVLNLFFIGIVVAFVSTRYRDIEQIINSLLTVMFFLTPVLWDAKVLGDKYYLLYFNPFFSFVDVLRTPLVSNEIPYYSLLSLTLMLLIFVPFATYLLGRFKNRVALWV
jgi:lipopolysaccharide transport system permease protein